MLRGLSHAQSLSIPLQDGIRLLHLPLPAGLSACLAVRLPRGRLPPGEDDGLTTFCVDPNNGLGLACSPVAHRLR